MQFGLLSISEVHFMCGCAVVQIIDVINRLVISTANTYTTAINMLLLEPATREESEKKEREKASKIYWVD